jgi:hypothetical protein
MGLLDTHAQKSRASTHRSGSSGASAMFSQSHANESFLYPLQPHH